MDITQTNRRPDGPMRDYQNSSAGGRGSMNHRSRSREREYNHNSNRYNHNNQQRRHSRSRSRSRDRSRRGGGGYDYDDDYYPEDDYGSRDNYSSSSSTYRTDRYRGRQDDYRGGGRGGYNDRRDHRDRGSYSRGGGHGGGNYSPNNSYHQQGNRDHDDDYDSYDSDSGNRFTSQSPNNKIIVRGLASHITEADIGSDLMQYNNLKPVSIRLIRRRNTGASRGFAFVEFSTKEEATRWMEYKQGVLMLQDQYRAVMQYSKTDRRGGMNAGGGNGGSAAGNVDGTDWFCSKCLVFNFKRRENCFKCYTSREEIEQGGEGWNEISNVLTKKILLRNLDVLTNEEGVLTILQEMLPLDQVAKISKILVCRDPLTNTSRGICYLFFDNLVDSMNVYNGLRDLQPALQIDNRDVGISYCIDQTANKEQQEGPANSSSARNYNDMDTNAYAGPMPMMMASEMHAAVQGGNNTYKYTAADVPRLAEYSAKLYATNAAEHDHYYKYYTQYYMGEIASGQFANLPTMSQIGGETANSGAAVAQSAMQRKMQQQQQGKKGGGRHSHQDTGYGAESQVTGPRMQLPNGKDGKKYPIPDVSQYQFEETSGYYYDPITGLYYDANSQYYYNSELSCYLYWDNDNRTYQLAPTAAGATASAAPSDAEKKDQKPKDNNEVDPAADGRAPDKVKHAKKIVKDMEKWAKQLNQKKEMGGALQLPVPVKEEHPLKQGGPLSGNGGCADVGFAILEKKDKMPLTLEPIVPIRSTPSAMGGSAAASKIVAYGSDSDNEGESERDNGGQVMTNEKDYVDFEKLTCLLCKRAFQSQEILAKHIKMSDLHKQNLAKYKLAKASAVDVNDPGSYRDRAKERRQKYGEADPPPMNKSKERFQKEIEKQASAAAQMAASSSVAQTPIGGGNVGNKLLKKMGWQEGTGLGRANQGRTNIIEVESRAGGAGLGTKTAGPPFAGGDYKTYIKKMMKQRYEQTE